MAESVGPRLNLQGARFFIVGAKLALQGFCHPVVSVDFLAGLQGVFDGVSLDTRLALQGTRFLSAMSVNLLRIEKEIYIVLFSV